MSGKVFDLDLDALEKLCLEPQIMKSVKHTRIDAQTIIESLKPHDIWSWTELIFKLEKALNGAKKNQEFFSSL